MEYHLIVILMIILIVIINDSDELCLGNLFGRGLCRVLVLSNCFSCIHLETLVQVSFMLLDVTN